MPDLAGVTPAAEPAAWENPLIPNKKLRALYTAMAELRRFEEHIASRSRGKNPASRRTSRGEEGCRVSTILDLKPGDLTSDSTDGFATAFLRGAKLSDLLQRTAHDLRSLPPAADPVSRLYAAMGAALALKARRQHLLTIAYVYRNELTVAEWKPILRFAAAYSLPIIFVVQTGVWVATKRTKAVAKPGQLSLASSACGVPGIPVDSADPVALYRVAQESTLRARAGGGPVLMECIPFQLAGKNSAPADPLLTMEESLLHRKIVDDAWLKAVVSRFQRRLREVAE